jgi:hypothetical protein
MKKTVEKVRDRMNAQGIPQGFLTDAEISQRWDETRNTIATAAKDPLKFARLVLEYGPVMSSQRERKQGVAILNRIEAGTASDEEKTWYQKLLAEIQRKRKQ